jgi:hypothetical protein
VLINPIIQTRTRHCRRAYHPTCDSIKCHWRAFQDPEGGIYEICCSDDMIFITIGSGIRLILRLLPQQFHAVVLVLLMGGIYGVRC